MSVLPKPPCLGPAPLKAARDHGATDGVPREVERLS